MFSVYIDVVFSSQSQVVIICRIVSFTDCFVVSTFLSAKECKCDVTLWNTLFLFLRCVYGVAILSSFSA